MPTEVEAVQENTKPAFAHAAGQLQQMAADVLKHAQAQGASAAEVEVSEGSGQTVSVRCGEVETIEYNRDKSIEVSVYLGQRRGHASTSDFSPDALRATVEAALSIARFTAEDPFAGLADAALLATPEDIQRDLDLFHPWNVSVERAIEIARSCEDAAFAVDTRIANSEGASVSTQQSHFVYANSRGFIGGYAGSRHWLSCAAIAEEGEQMQRDDWYTIARNAAQLDDAALVGRIAGARALRRLGARKIATTQTPVIFEAPIASSLIGHFVSAVSGGSLYRKSSFLLDSLDQEVFASLVHISEDPFIPRGLASGTFDEEGVAVHQRDVVNAGICCGYFLGSYSARKLGMQTTGNAGGSHNLLVTPTAGDLPALMKQMNRGLLVTELLGQGVNPVTGDYSRGAAGFWIENGEIAYPVEEITIAGNLKQMFKDIAAIGNDVLVRGARQCGSILISNMTVAGN